MPKRSLLPNVSLLQMVDSEMPALRHFLTLLSNKLFRSESPWINISKAGSPRVHSFLLEGRDLGCLGKSYMPNSLQT